MLINKTLFVLLLLGFAALAQQTGAFTDPRDNKTYKTTKIGTQVWLGENLNYEAEGSVCYKNDPANCDKYGRLYNWNTAMKVCPKGWHLSSNEEWEELVAAVGGQKTAGKHLKAKSGWNWYGFDGNGLDSYEFFALPIPDDLNIGLRGSWWSATEYDETRYGYTNNLAYKWIMREDSERVGHGYEAKSILFTVRCLQD